ncbi:MAG: sigma-70 family RNA polymerase sigma factor [Sphingobium sp.]
MDDPTEKIRWFQLVILPCQPRLRGRLKRILPAHIDLDDIISETLTRAYAVHDWRAIHEGFAFVLRIARNFLIDQARREAVISFDYMADLEELGKGVSYDAMLTARDELRRIEKIMDKLPTQQRRAFLLRRVDGFSLAEIAVKMHLSVSTVEKHLGRALAGIARETLKDEEIFGERLASRQEPMQRDRKARGPSGHST